MPSPILLLYSCSTQYTVQVTNYTLYIVDYTSTVKE